MKKISDFVTAIEPGRANITLNKAFYSTEAVTAAVYPFISNYHVLVTPDGEEQLTVVFECRKNDCDLEEDLKCFLSSIIDQQLRLQLEASNGRVRELIVGHAFSSIDLHESVDSLERKK